MLTANLKIFGYLILVEEDIGFQKTKSILFNGVSPRGKARIKNFCVKNI